MSTGVVEVYRVTKRVELGIKATAVCSEKLQQLLKDIDKVWNNLISFMSLAALTVRPKISDGFTKRNAIITHKVTPWGALTLWFVFSSCKMAICEIQCKALCKKMPCLYVNKSFLSVLMMSVIFYVPMDLSNKGNSVKLKFI